MAQTITKEKKKTKKKTWTRFRHKVITNLLRPFLALYCRVVYGLKASDFRDRKGQYLILLNHQTPFDQFFVGLTVKNPVYYLATEDIFSNGWVSSLIKWLVAPIPIKKQTTDVTAVMNCIRVVREGGSICIAPEGNRTYSGKTEYMNPAIAPMAKKLGLPILLFRIDGGYGMEPRWSDVVRRGKLTARVERVIEPQEAKAMSNEELYAAIQEGLYVNEACTGPEFHHKNLAQYMERCIYICPHCGLSTFESNGDILACKKCGRKVRYLPNKELQGIDWEVPFRYVNDWYEYQMDYVNQLDTLSMTEKPIYEDRAKVSEVIVYARKEVLYPDAAIALYGDRIVIEDMVLPFNEISTVTVLGRNKLNIYHGDRIYQFKGSKRMNSLKYVHIFYRSKNLSKGDPEAKFLGI